MFAVQNCVFLITIAVVSTEKVIWNGNSAKKCDFSARDDFKSVLTDVHNCPDMCARTYGCTHYVWSLWSGSGTCYLKHDPYVTKDDARVSSVESAVCGINAVTVKWNDDSSWTVRCDFPTIDDFVHVPSIAYCLLKNCLFIPKLTYMLRTCAFWKYKSLTDDMDNYLKTCLETIINITIDENKWIQTILPISMGGLGIRRISDIALPAFLSSLHGTNNLASLILSNTDSESTLHLWNESLEQWNTINENMPSNRSVQKEWDSINLERIVSDEILLQSSKDIARFKALQEPESGGWLQVIPSNNIGTTLSNQDFQICVALRLGINHFTKHKCICGSMVDESGTHGLSCPNAKGTWPRHLDLNHTFHRALTSAHRSSTLEPIGLSRDDGKRPDGTTLSPWSKGKRLVWDVTCADTLAPTYLNSSMKKAGSAAELACSRKHSHYTKIKAANFIFVGLAVETLGPWCKETKSFVDAIGKMLIEESGDIRAKKFLCNRISLAIQRGNAASILGTHPTNEKLTEIFDL